MSTQAKGDVGSELPSQNSPPEGYCAIPVGEDQEARQEESIQLSVLSGQSSRTEQDDGAHRLLQGQPARGDQTPRCVVRPRDTSEASLRKLVWAGVSLMGTCLTLASPGIPFGKYHISYSDVREAAYKWPAAAFILAYVYLFFAFVHFGKINHPRPWIVLGQALQMLHFFEEHGLEGLDARRSPFKRYFNILVRQEVMSQESWSPDCFSDFNILLICLTHGLGLFSFAMWEGPRYGAGVVTFGISLIDGIMHATLCVFTDFSYNPGVISAILLIIPSSAYYFTLVNRYVLRSTISNPVTGIGVISGCITWLLLLVCLLNFLPSVLCIVAFIIAVMHAEVRMYRLTKAPIRP